MSGFRHIAIISHDSRDLSKNKKRRSIWLYLKKQKKTGLVQARITKGFICARISRNTNCAFDHTCLLRVRISEYSNKNFFNSLAEDAGKTKK